VRKQTLDKTKQQYKLGETVFAVTQKNNAACFVEGRICGAYKNLDDEDAEVSYTVDDVSPDRDPFNRFVTAAYDDIFKDSEAAQQKVLATIEQAYEKAKESLVLKVSAVKAASAKQTAIDG
jgi:hypothetical protein